MRSSIFRQHAFDRWRWAVASASVVAALILPSIAAAQQPMASPADTSHSQKQAPFFTVGDVILAGVFAGATMIAAPLDRHLALQLRAPGNQANRFLEKNTPRVETLTSPGAFIIGASLYTRSAKSAAMTVSPISAGTERNRCCLPKASHGS